MNPNQLQNIPSLEQQATMACSQELDTLLKKYGCDLAFQELRVNGVVVKSSFIVIKKPSEPQGLKLAPH